MPTLGEVRTAIKATLVLALPKTAVLKHIIGNPPLPCIMIQPATNDYLVVMRRGADTYELDLHILVPGDDEVAQDALDEYVSGIGDKSIALIVENNKTLGRSDCSAVVARMTNYGFRFALVGNDHVGATLRLRVTVTN